MVIRRKISSLVCAMMLSITVLAGISTTPAAAAAKQISLPHSFHQNIYGTTYLWTLVSYPYAYNSYQGRLYSGTWDVKVKAKHGYEDLGTISVGVNTHYHPDKHSYYIAMDTATTIKGLGWAGESLVHTNPPAPNPNHGGNLREAPIGSGIRAHGVFEYDIWSPIFNQPHNENTTFRVISGHGPLGHKMLDKMGYWVAEQSYYFTRLQTVGGLIKYQAPKEPTGRKLHSAPIPIPVVAMGFAGVVLGVAGSIVKAAIDARELQGAQKAWAIASGIATILGTQLIIISGVSITGWIIAAKTANHNATGEIQCIAGATNLVNQTTVHNIADEIANEVLKRLKTRLPESVFTNITG